MRLIVLDLIFHLHYFYEYLNFFGNYFEKTNEFKQGADWRKPNVKR